MTLKDFLRQVGLIKNQILLFVILGCLIFLHFGPEYFGESMWQRTTCFFLTFIVFAGTLVFYIWAAINLPGSSQELMFETNAEHAIEQHQTATTKTTTKENRGH